MTARTRTTTKADASAFNANTAGRPLWANAEGHPSIWIRWTPVHETWVESEQPMTMRKLGTIGRIVRCGRYGTWLVGDWRPRCATCHGNGRVPISETETSECPDCLAHPGWVVG
jgi:hypothetical protein